jgi:hypothetical protein
VADPSETTQVSARPDDPEQAELLDAVRSLSAQVGGLQSELRSLRGHGRSLPASSLDSHGWGDGTAPARRESSAWIRSLDRPSQRAVAVPRLFLEILFLVAVAVAVTLAELDEVAIVLLMSGAWILVALAEWTAAQTASRRSDVFEAPLSGAVFADDPSWFEPPGERAGVDRAALVVEEEQENATKLPPPAE